MNKLYVIGNGFDKHHGMPCGYGDFKNWLMVEQGDVEQGDGYLFHRKTKSVIINS